MQTVEAKENEDKKVFRVTCDILVARDTPTQAAWTQKASWRMNWVIWIKLLILEGVSESLNKLEVQIEHCSRAPAPSTPTWAARERKKVGYVIESLKRKHSSETL